MNWRNWNLGGKLLFVTTCAAVASMFMSWIDIGFASQSGLAQQAFLLLILWIYPVVVLLMNKSMNRFIGVACAVSSFVFTTIYIDSKTVVLFGKAINVSSTGAWLFLLASIVLIIGVLTYKPSLKNASKK